VDRNDEPITIVPDIEDYKTVNVVRIGKTGPQFQKVPPSCRFHNPDPSADFLCGLPIIRGGLLQALDRDDMH
jgi:hypothetical protein